MAKKERQISKRVNFFDGQRVTESDLDAEQIHKISVSSDTIIDFHGSGVVNSSPFVSSILLDTRFPGKYSENDEENESKEDIESGEYDGKPIYFDKQPSDNIRGNRLVLELVDADIIGRKYTKALLIGWAFDGMSSKGQLVGEIIEFKTNGEALSRHYYREVVSILFNNFSGGTGQTYHDASKVSENLITNTSGYMIVKEAEPLKVYPSTEMSFQVESPNLGLRNFITSDTDIDIIEQIEAALGSAISITSMYIELDGKEQISFDYDADTTISYGQKFLSNSNNIQKIDLLLSVEEDTSASPGEEFNWSGDIVISIRELSSKPKYPTDAVPDDLIDFDPELSPLVEMSYSQEDLKDLGYILNGTPQLVIFNFSGTLVADPNIDPSIEIGKHYAFLISRNGDNRVGTIVLEKGFDKVIKKNEEGIALSTLEQYSKQESKFTEYDPNTQRYVDDSSSSLWYVVHSSGIEVVNGTAYTDDGFAVTIEKTEEYVGGAEVSKFVRNVPLVSMIENSDNYVVLSHLEEFTTPSVHPRTGNYVFTRIGDAVNISVVNSTDLTELLKDTTPLILARVKDKNVKDAQSITGVFNKPGMVHADRIVIHNPSSEMLSTNLIGRIIIPDTGCNCTAKYRIAKTECMILKAGDLNRDGSLTLSDIDPLLDVVGNTINSEVTERNILGGALDLIDFVLSDLDANNTVDGFDIELLEDAIDGYVNFTAQEDIKFLTLYLENILEESDSPIIFTDTGSSGITIEDTNELTFVASTEQIALMIRVGDIVEIDSLSSDAGTFTITSKVISADDVTVILGVSDSTGADASFVGDTGFNIVITSGTNVNTFANNSNLVNIPFESSNYQISFIEAPFKPEFLDVCDLRRFVGVSFLEEATTECVCEPESCATTDECSPVYKNQTYVPNDLYVKGDILSEPGIPHHGDIEYAQIKLPLPPGTITDCSVNLYTNFIKAASPTSCKTAAGYPAMKYSDGTYVGCKDNGSDTDISKGRVKISQAIASLYVDALIDGYATDGYADETASSTSQQIVSEDFVDYSYDSFSAWTDDPFNNVVITTITHPSGANEPANFSLTTSSDSSLRYGRLDQASESDNFSDDFIIDWTASRVTWPGASVSAGDVKSGMILTITNDDSTSAIYEMGWAVQSDGITNLYFTGATYSALSLATSTFSHIIVAPDAIGDEVLFRFRRTNDVITAHYVIPGSISESETPFGQYVRIGTNPDIQAGFGTGSLTFGISQDNAPNAGLSFFTKLHEVVIRSELSSDDSPETSVTIGRDDLTKIINRAAFTFPINLTGKTNIVSADLILTSKTAGTITDSFNIIPLDILNADNLSRYFDYPIDQDISRTVSFVPGIITDGGSITIDITATIVAMVAETGHLPGYIKGFIIEPDVSADSEFDISTEALLEIGYEDATTGVIFKVGVSLDSSTGIATLNTKNILYDSILEECRTVINFGVYLKKSGFANNDVSVSIADLSRIGLGTCLDSTNISEDDECYFIAGSSATGVIVEGPFPCQTNLP